jgi:acyl-CoA thioesterase-1
MLAADGMRRLYRKAILVASLVCVAAAPREKVVVFLGDSLTAGYGLAAGESFPSILERGLRADGATVRVVNAGVSGDTSAGALRRLDWVLRQHPDVVVVELGANDALRGQPTSGIEANLRAIVLQSRDGGAKVLLVGMRIPTSYGPDYAGEFAAIYPRLAKELGVPVVPFLLEGVAGRPGLNLEDGIHPNYAGQKIVAANVRPYLLDLLR